MLNITKTLENGVLTVKPEGRLDTLSAHKFEASLRERIDSADTLILDFENLVRAVLKTMEQRTETAARMGHCVICHPNGLLDMVRTGMITSQTTNTM